MKLFFFPTLVLFIFLFAQSCKKEEPTVEYNHIPNVAPCSKTEKEYIVDSIVYGPTSKFPNAPFHIFVDNGSLEIAFNKVPETGMYQMVSFIDYGWEDNKIAMVTDSGSFIRRTGFTDGADIYVDNYDGELIISYCDIDYNSYTFNTQWYCYVGNGPDSVLIKMNY